MAKKIVTKEPSEKDSFSLLLERLDKIIELLQRMQPLRGGY